MLREDTTTEGTCQVQELKQAWGTWLTELGDRAGGWDWWATLTFRDPTPQEMARGYTRRGWGYAKAAWSKFEASWPNPLGGQRWVRMFELQKSRDVVHIHALVGGVGDLRRDQAWAWWFQRYGIARILPYDRDLGAGFYLCKYVIKELGDIQFSTNFPGVIL